MLIACSPAPQATDPASVTKALFSAINQGKAEVAANSFAKDGEFITAFGQPRGAEKIQAFFKMTLIPLKARVDVKEVKADGENVTGIFTFSSTNLGKDAPIPMKLSGIVQEGKIKTMTWSSN
jgi:hypothetical protein